MRSLPLLAAVRRALVAAVVLGALFGLSVPPVGAQESDDTGGVVSVWRVVPDTRSVEVEITYDRVNGLDGPIGGVFETLPSTAVDVTATVGGRSLDITAGETAGEFTEWSVAFSAPVDPGARESWTLRYRIPSDPVDAVVHAFIDDAVVWVSSFAVGGTATAPADHRVELPARYELELDAGLGPVVVEGDTRIVEARAGLTGYTSSVVLAEDPTGRGAEGVADAVVPLVVAPLPSDDAWAARVASPAADLLESLAEVFGSPVPYEGVVVEELLVDTVRHSATIDVADDGALAVVGVDAAATTTEIAHQLAHLWLRDAVSGERWFAEGVAASVGAIGASTAGYVVEPAPSRADLHAELLQPLHGWSSTSATTRFDPAVVVADEQARGAAHVVVGSVLAEIGVPALLDVIDVLAGDTITYEGAPAAEAQPTDEDWRVVLDALVEVGGSAQAPALFEELVVDEEGVAELARWREARAAWSALVERGGGWEMPLAVRRPMASWDFEAFDAAVAAATAALDRRDQMGEIIGLADLEVPESSRVAFESAADGLGVVVGRFDAQIVDATEIVAAARAVGRDHGLLAEVGLLGEDPDGDLDRLRALWRDGDTAAAAEQASELVERLDRAPGRGTVRILVPAAFVAGVVAIYLAIRGRLRSRRAAPPAEEASALVEDL